MNTGFQTQRLVGGGPTQPDRSPRDEQGAVIDLSGIVNTLWRGKFLILATVLVAVLLGAYQAYFVATPLYRSQAVVMLNNRDEQVLNLDSVVGGLGRDTSVVNTEVEVLRSRDLLGLVVDRLNLVADPEFNGRLRPPDRVAQAKALVKAALGLGPTARDLPDEERQRQYERQATIDALRRAVSVRNVPHSLVFEITVETGNARKSALIAETLVDSYIRNQIEVKFEATEQATSWLADRVAELRTELEAAEVAATTFGTDTDLISPEALRASERQLKDLRERLADTQIRRTATAERLAALRAAGTDPERAAAAEDAQLDAMLPRLGDPAIAQAFEARFDTLVMRAAQEVARLDDQAEVLRASLAEFEARVEKQNADLIALQQLQREAEASRLLYEHFLARLKETSAQQGIQQADSRVLSSAIIPVQPSAPRKSRILALSGFLGLLAGAGLLLLREAMNTRFRDSRTLQAFSGYTVLGEIPRFPVRRRKELFAYLTDKPTSAPAEAIRNLRTSVLMSNIDDPPQILMFSSSVPGEGKTTVSLSMAHNLVGLGRTVLLVEGDVRRRILSDYFDTGDAAGMMSVLTGDRTLDEVVVHDTATGIDILLGGEARANAADIFASEKFAALLTEARKRYDHVVIDTPPVLMVPDARIIAPHADATIFVVKWDSTSRALLSETLSMFESVNARITGLVLNNINLRVMKRYGYGGKYGAYGKYGKNYHVN